MLCDDGPIILPSIERRINDVIDSMLTKIADWESPFAVLTTKDDTAIFTYFDTYKLDEGELVVNQVVYRKRYWLRDFFKTPMDAPEHLDLDPKVKYVVVSEDSVVTPLTEEQVKRLNDAQNDWYVNRAAARKERDRKERMERAREQLTSINNRM